MKLKCTKFAFVVASFVILIFETAIKYSLNIVLKIVSNHSLNIFLKITLALKFNIRVQINVWHPKNPDLFPLFEGWKLRIETGSQ